MAVMKGILVAISECRLSSARRYIVSCSMLAQQSVRTMPELAG